MGKHGCSVDFQPWTSRDDMQLRGVPQTMRDFALINCAWQDRTTKPPRPSSWQEAKRGFFVDTHDSIVRSPWGKIPALKQEQTVYSCEMDYTLSAWAGTKLHDWADHVKLGGISDKDLRSLSGESFALPPVTILHFLYYRNPWSDWFGMQGSKSI